MKRIQFKLSMPSRGSWNGQWSGGDSNYTVTKSIADKKYKELFGDDENPSWSYDFGDGWRASISAKVVKGRQPKSDGFCGYEWMVKSILLNNEIS